MNENESEDEREKKPLLLLMSLSRAKSESEWRNLQISKKTTKMVQNFFLKVVIQEKNIVFSVLFLVSTILLCANETVQYFVITIVSHFRNT